MIDCPKYFNRNRAKVAVISNPVTVRNICDEGIIFQQSLQKLTLPKDSAHQKNGPETGIFTR